MRHLSVRLSRAGAISVRERARVLRVVRRGMVRRVREDDGETRLEVSVLSRDGEGERGDGDGGG